MKKQKKGQSVTAQKPKNAKKEFIIIFPIGVVLLIAALIVLFVVYRPFVKWIKIDCSFGDGNYVEINEYDVLYRYEINGVQYEKILKYVPYDGRDSHSDHTRKIIYVNANNPEDVKHGSQGGAFFLTFIIGFAVLGAFFLWFAFHIYKGIQKKQGISKQKKKQ